MEHKFRRALFFPLFNLLPAVLFILTFFLQLATKNPVAFFTLIAGILFLINAIFLLSTPYLIIDRHTLQIRDALLNQKTVPLNDIKKIEFPNKKRIDVYRENGQTVRIRLMMVARAQREELTRRMKELADVRLTQA